MIFQIIQMIKSGDPVMAIVYFAFLTVSVLIALTAHECAHGYIAMKCGDNTARNLGRLSLNPTKHLDLFGFLCMMFVGFGWAKPVPVNSRNLRKPRRDIALVSLAGPMANFILAFAGILLGRIFVAIGSLFTSSFAITMAVYIWAFFYIFASMNMGLCLFNLIPLPPLDGSKILASVIPQKYSARYLDLERYTSIVIFGLIIASNVLDIDVFYPLEWLESVILSGINSLVGLIPFLS